MPSLYLYWMQPKFCPRFYVLWRKSGIGVGSLTVQQPNLEAVFLRLTGERLTVTSG